MCKNDCCNGDTQPRQDGLSFSYYPQAGVVKAKLNGVEWNVMTAIHKLCRNHSKFLNCYPEDALFMTDQFFGKSRANQKIVAAEAEAQSAKIAADAEAYAIKAVQEQLAQSPEYIEYERIQKWNGQYPEVMGNTVNPFVTLK